tara:strand:- start:70 stop:480 length:411 start_codon:yes stop_codon:yes gene_type:complete
MAQPKQERTRSTEEIVEALLKSHGIKSQAARILGVSRPTVDKYIRDIPEAAAAFKEADEALLDAAEGVLYTKALREKDGLSLRYLLDTKGKRRGYGKQSLEIEHSGRVEMTTDQALAEIERAQRVAARTSPKVDAE